ncbi:MAG: tol-pal system protein YbgF [Ideonella sp. MAG2]|nr:MAG: tol-pal system protein YbgF [Ideonella sp. MAG2]
MALAVAALVAAPGAQAGLFEDDEARKAILDLRARANQADELRQAQAATLKQMQEQIQVLQRSLLDLNNQLDQIRGDNARLRGQLEQTQREVAELQRKQKDIVQSVDDRVRKLEPQSVTLDGRSFTADPEEIKMHDEAMALLRNGEFERAVPALAGFLRKYPESGYGDSARYWMGNAQYGARAYKEAVQTFRAFATAAPEHPRAPEALLALANSQAELRDSKAARRTLEELIKIYPKSEAALAAKDRLLTLK